MAGLLQDLFQTCLSSSAYRPHSSHHDKILLLCLILQKVFAKMTRLLAKRAGSNYTCPLAARTGSGFDYGRMVKMVPAANVCYPRPNPWTAGGSAQVEV